jgi:hypothetical protein
MWKAVTQQGYETTLINLDNVSSMTRHGSLTTIRFVDGTAEIIVDERPEHIVPSAKVA